MSTACDVTRSRKQPEKGQFIDQKTWQNQKRNEKTTEIKRARTRQPTAKQASHRMTAMRRTASDILRSRKQRKKGEL
jgi:hypothetical protein